MFIGVGISAGEVWLGLWNPVAPQTAAGLILAILLPISLGYIAITHEVERRSDALRLGTFRNVCVTESDWSYGAVLTTPVEVNLRYARVAQENRQFYIDYKAQVLQLLRDEELRWDDLATHTAESNPTQDARSWRKIQQGRALKLIRAALHAEFTVDPEFQAIEEAYAVLKPE